MDLPRPLIEQVREASAVLFLGAGATFGAKVNGNQDPPDGPALRDRIAKRFLSKELHDQDLPWVAELASSAANLFEVQDFIAEQFQGIAPASFHRLLPTFVWRGIATTNFDRLVECVYDEVASPAQAVVPFLSNDDRVDQKLRDRSAVALLKLHGCVTRTHDSDLPLILGADQYASSRQNRDRLYKMFEEWAVENTVVFVGHRLQDPNLRSLLLDLIGLYPSRPRYYLVRPHVDQIEADFWATKGVTVLDGTFEDFLRKLDAEIDARTRALATHLTSHHPIERRWVSATPPSPSLRRLLDSGFELLDKSLRVVTGDPKDFYRGAGLGWFPIRENLDVGRRLTEQILEDVVLRPEEDRPSRVELYAVKAEAGAGKTVLLRRLAWDAAMRAGVIALYYSGAQPASLEPLRELAEGVGERLFLFVDDAGQNLAWIREILTFSRDRNLRVTVFTAERVNEWNVSCEDLESYLSDTFVLRYLSHSEIDALVALLEQHESLGPHLEPMARPDRVAEFEKRAGRQLLVALHEATLGRPFERILVDEYEHLSPPEAKSLYLTVCTLNRLKVPVRAGLISRVHGIPFKEFQKRLFKPLEHVVFVATLPWGDYGYRARHSEIAQIVFDQILADTTERFHEYSRVLRALNPIYSVDASAIRDMVRAKWVHSLFPNYDDARAIFDIAFEVLPRDAYLLQQRANYERIRPDGNLRLAETLLSEARELNPHDSSIVHTLAEVIRAKAEAAREPLERAKLRAEAGAVLRSISSQDSSDRYAMVTRLKLATDAVRDVLSDPEAADRPIDDALRSAEQSFEIARQRYPGDQYVLTAEAEFAALLRDHERSLEALQSAWKSNPRDPYIASRLSSLLVSRGEVDRARKCLEEALESNGGDKRLNFQYAEVLRVAGSDAKTLAYYYRRSFSEWDENYNSQFWYARFAYESSNNEDVGEARKVFRHLRDVPMAHDERIEVRDVIGGTGTPKEYTGTVTRVESTYGFITADGRGDSLFMHESDVSTGMWADLRSGVRVAFNIGFSLRGPKALHVQAEAT